jgi:tRNA(Ile)-lysidine synthetase-like protein
VVPILSRVFGGLAGFQRSLEALAQDAVYLEAAAREVGLPLTGRDLVRCPPALLPRVLRDWLCVRTGQHHLVRRTGVERLRQALGRLGGREELVPLGNGLCVAVSRTSLRMAESVVPLPARSWTWQRDPVLALPEIGGELRAGQGCPCQADLVSRDPDTEWFAPASLPGTLVVRSWQPGDRMVPFGGRTPRKLQDLFVNAGIPRGARSAVPVVVADSVICWVAGVRRSRIAPVAADEPAVCFRFVRSTG